MYRPLEIYLLTRVTYAIRRDLSTKDERIAGKR